MKSQNPSLTNQILKMRDSGINSPFIGFKPFHVRRKIVTKFYPTKRNRHIVQ